MNRKPIILITLFLTQNVLAQSEPMDTLAYQLGLRAKLKEFETLKQADPQTCGPEKRPAFVNQYTCQTTTKVDGTETATKDTPKPTSFYVSLETWNDNKFLGLADGGRDAVIDRNGFTYGTNLGIKKVSGNKEFGLNISSSLYSKANTQGYTPGSKYSTTYNYFDITTGEFLGKTQSTFSTYPNSLSDIDLKNHIRIIDNLKVEAFFKTGKSFSINGTVFIKGSLGVEKRSRTKSIAADTQDWWHKLTKFTRYDYVPPEGNNPNLLKREEVKNFFMSYLSSYTPFPGHKEFYVNQITYTEFYDGKVLYPEELQTPVSLYSLQLGAGAGIEKRIDFSTNCELKWTSEVGAKISTEEKQIIGPNSQVYGSTSLNTNLFRSKKLKGHRVESTVTQALVYYPTPVPQSSNMGGQFSVGVGTNHKVGSALLSPSIILQVPIGREIFDEFKDGDSYMGIKFVVSWPKGKK